MKFAHSIDASLSVAFKPTGTQFIETLTVILDGGELALELKNIAFPVKKSLARPPFYRLYELHPPALFFEAGDAKATEEVTCFLVSERPMPRGGGEVEVAIVAAAVVLFPVFVVVAVVVEAADAFASVTVVTAAAAASVVAVVVVLGSSLSPPPPPPPSDLFLLPANFSLSLCLSSSAAAVSPPGPRLCPRGGGLEDVIAVVLSSVV